jgi:hypothetical protein
LGANWNHRHPSEIMREIALLTPLVAGVTFCLTKSLSNVQRTRLRVKNDILYLAKGEATSESLAQCSAAQLGLDARLIHLYQSFAILNQSPHFFNANDQRRPSPAQQETEDTSNRMGNP